MPRRGIAVAVIVIVACLIVLGLTQVAIASTALNLWAFFARYFG